MKTLKPKQQWVKTEITTVWPYPQHLLVFDGNVKVHVDKRERTADIAVITSEPENCTWNANSVRSITEMRWEGCCLVIHPTPSTGYNFKYPAYTVRSALKSFSNQAMNYLKTVFSKFSSVLDWTCCLIHVICQTASAALSLFARML